MIQLSQQIHFQNLEIEKNKKEIKEMENKIKDLKNSNATMYVSLNETINAINEINSEFNYLINLMSSAQEIYSEDLQENKLPTLPYFNKQNDDDILN